MFYPVPSWWNGRHKRLKISRLEGRAGSSPAEGTTFPLDLHSYNGSIGTSVGKGNSIWVKEELKGVTNGSFGLNEEDDDNGIPDQDAVIHTLQFHTERNAGGFHNPR